MVTPRFLLLVLCSYGLFQLPCYGVDPSREDDEPSMTGAGVISLFDGKVLSHWDVPSNNWRVEDNCIVGETTAGSLETPEWLYTKQTYKDFIFSCEIKLTGDKERNTGIWYRAAPFEFDGIWADFEEDDEDDIEKDSEEEEDEEEVKPYVASAGYELDAFSDGDFEEGGENHWGALHDSYKRQSFGAMADPTLIKKLYTPEDWNRVFIRARGNRLEHWVNGVKVVDHVDTDPNAPRQGKIGLQLHDGSRLKVSFRDIKILPLSIGLKP